MNFENKIVFKCNNEYEWTTCQNILFSLNFSWKTTNKSLLKNNTFPIVICIENFSKPTSSYLTLAFYTEMQIIESFDYKLYHAKDLINYSRQQKLNKLL